MKFSEKLQKLRKKNDLSQEKLADMLEVTRQSVSKWESGQTYPEMDKLISMCKIFKCSLDDLTNDEVSDIHIEENKKNNFNSLVDNILELISKTYNMFKEMPAFDIFKCLLFMFFLGLILLIFKIPFSYLANELGRIFSIISNETIVTFLSGIFTLIINLCYFALYILVLVYIFKIGYLDKYEENKKSNLKKDDIDTKKTTLKKADCDNNVVNVNSSSKPKNDPVFVFLGRIFMIFIKFLIIFFTVPFVFSLFGLSLSFAVVFLLIFKKVLYLGVLFGLIFSIILNILIIKLVIDFVFNKKVNVKRLFITFIIGLVGVGVSTGIFCLEIAGTRYINDAPKGVASKSESQIIAFKEDMRVDNCYDCIVEYKVDNSLKNNVKLELAYYDRYISVNINRYREDKYTVLGYSNYENDNQAIYNLASLILEDLSNKEVHNYSILYRKRFIIYANTTNINKLKDNYLRYNQEQEKNELKESNSDDAIDALQDELDQLQEQNRVLEEKNDELNSKIEHYNKSIKGMLND